LEFFPAQGIWFPRKVRFSQVDGDSIETEEANIKIIKLNEPVDGTFFSLSKMNIPAGTKAVLSPSSGSGRFVWDGNSLLPDSPPPTGVKPGRD